MLRQSVNEAVIELVANSVEYAPSQLPVYRIPSVPMSFR